jgi:glycerophosphoryl diester phosphodiesterase
MPRRLPLVFASLLFAGSAWAVEIVAHRGASHDAPENTLASNRLAWQQGTDVVETDIFLTKDGKLAVSHDKNTKRTAGRDAEIASLTVAELKQLDAGVWKGPQFAGERIPLLEEQIALIPAGKRMFVEIKIGPEIVPELKRVLTRMGASERNITIISFNYESLVEVRKQLPALKTQYLVGHRNPNAKKKGADAKPQPTLEAVIAQAKAAQLTGLDLQSTWPLTAADTRKIRAAGLELHVWTVDDPAVAQHWIELGALSVTTNRPGFLREQLKL